MFPSTFPPVRRPALALAATAALALAACGGGGGSGGSDGPTQAVANGSLNIALTDAPACGYEAVNVTVEKVRVHRSDAAAESDAGWSELVLAEPRRVNLLDLMNGVLAPLGSLSLPSGSYRQVRLVLAANGGSNPPANSIVLEGGAETELKTPSGQQSGLKIKSEFEVPAGRSADLVLDFDACKSVVRAGNSGQYLLKPVIRAIPVLAEAGNAIEGHVDPALVGVTVSAQKDGVVLKATAPDDGGRFTLAPIEAGDYTLVVAAPFSATAVITGVPVSADARTVLATSEAPLALGASEERNAAGVVTAAGSTTVPEATVRALQKLSGGLAVELVSRQVDASTGGYAFALPTAAPGVSAYAPGATYTFTPDTGAAAKYTLEASAPERATQTADIDLTGTDATADFQLTAP